MSCAYDAAMKESRKAFDEMIEHIDRASSIVICAHTDPDGDALGSGLGLAQVIRNHWPEKQVTNLLADPSPVPRLYQFLPGADSFVSAEDYEGDPDLFISVDLPVPARLNKGEAVLARSKSSISIDHHPSEAPFGDVSLTRTSAAATGVIIAELAIYLGDVMTKDLANCLYCAIVTDTGRFQYQNADAEAFAVTGALVDSGASPSYVSLNVYQSFRLEYLHLESIIMGRIVTFDKGRISYSYATCDDLVRTGAQPDECDGLIDVVRSVAGSEVSLFLKGLQEGTVRGNLRAKGSCDVSKVARVMGGGGHVAAAGFTAAGGIDDVLERVLPMLEKLLDGTFDESEYACDGRSSEA